MNVALFRWMEGKLYGGEITVTSTRSTFGFNNNLPSRRFPNRQFATATCVRQLNAQRWQLGGGLAGSGIRWSRNYHYINA